MQETTFLAEKTVYYSYICYMPTLFWFIILLLLIIILKSAIELREIKKFGKLLIIFSLLVGAVQAYGHIDYAYWRSKFPDTQFELIYSMIKFAFYDIVTGALIAYLCYLSIKYANQRIKKQL